ncbi:MAG TPA: GGDEF domain-containing protein [Rudaea sp.]|nr:GGDEF domain-containing protein [Rudaea sp.]
MALDIRTLIMLAAVVALLNGASLRYVLREYPADLSPSIRLWTLGVLAQATAWILFGLRDQIPDWLSIVGANALLSLAFAEQVHAVRLFRGLPVGRAAVYAPAVAVLLDEIVFTYAVPSMRLRLLTATPWFCLQMIQGGMSLVSSAAASRRSGRLTAAAFFALAAVLAARIIYESLHTQVLRSAFWDSPMQTIVFSFASLFPVVATLGFVLMCSDQSHQELERLAMLDPLTGISNRRTLDVLAMQALASAQRHIRPLALLLIDADHFKRINDECGHAAGDDALRLLAATLRRGLRNEDLLGRLGGEEFVAVLPEGDTEDALASAERLRRAVEELDFAAAGRPVPLRISIGVATLRDGDDFAALLRRADAAMYAAKRAGRNCVRGPADVADPAAAGAMRMG